VPIKEESRADTAQNSALRRSDMFVSSDFLGYLKNKSNLEKNSRPLVTAPQKNLPGGNDKAPPVRQVTEKQEHRAPQEEVDYLNDRPSALNVIL
jgi:hypothetical protein